MTNPRFSRAVLLEYAQCRAVNLQGEHDFNPDNGWAQVAYMRNRRPDELVERAVAYGEYRAMLDLIEHFELLS